MIKEYFYEKTGMYIDFDQISGLPDIDTFIDIGVGDQGTPDLYQRYSDKGLILIDPLSEAGEYAKNNLQHRKYEFFQKALGQAKGTKTINVETGSGKHIIGRSSLLKITDLNDEGNTITPRIIEIDTLDNVLSSSPSLGRTGIKIDTEGYELDVIKGAGKTLKSAKFVISETRHNHESFHGCYKLHEFMEAMRENNFQLTMILTAKPLIADLVFQPLNDLNKS